MLSGFMDNTMDIVKRLRFTAKTALPSRTSFTRLNDDASDLLGMAADEIERLRRELAAASGGSRQEVEPSRAQNQGASNVLGLVGRARTRAR
jgi:BMFP domain-containing protein YqiC